MSRIPRALKAVRHVRLGDREAVTFVGAPRDGWRDVYHLMLTMPLPALIGILAVTYMAVNLAFAGLYSLDPGGVAQTRPGHFWDLFFFSVQTLDTLGYGVMAPKSDYANIVVAFEAFVGLFNLGLATSVLFARISRPTARIMFSRKAVIAPLNGTPTLMLRAANRRANLVLEAEVNLTLAHDVTTLEGQVLRRFDSMAPLRARTPLFFLTWQIMHQIDEASPLFGLAADDLAARKAEILVSIRGLDETFVSDIHARASYLPHELIWNARLADILSVDPDGRRRVNYARFDDVEPLVYDSAQTR